MLREGGLREPAPADGTLAAPPIRFNWGMTNQTPAAVAAPLLPSLETTGPFDTTDGCRAALAALSRVPLGQGRDALLAALGSALDTVDFVLGDFVACQQGEPDRGFAFEDCEATASATRAAFPGAFRAAQIRYARENCSLGDWQEDVANGDTRLGYEDWLMHQVESWG